MKQDATIQGWGKLSTANKQAVRTMMDSKLSLFFMLCQYNEKELADKFENSGLLIKRRNAEMKLLNKLCDKTGYTPEYYYAICRQTYANLYKTLPTIQAFKTNIETGKFTGVSQKTLISWMKPWVSWFCWALAPTFEDLGFDIDLGVPNFAVDFTLIVKKTDPNPYNYDPTGKTPEELETERLAELKRLADEAEAAKQKNRLMLGGGIGLAFLALVAIKNK